MSRQSRRHRILFGLTVLLSLAILAPAQVAAMTVYSASVAYSTCSSYVSWRGEVPYDNSWWAGDEQTVGTVRLCFTVYRVSDSDPTGDYYVVGTRVDWRTSYDANSRATPDNYGKVNIRSSLGAVNNVYFREPDTNIALNQSCTDFSVGISYGIFGGSLSERFCNGGKLNMEAFSSTSAQWGSPGVNDTPRWETTYMQKVGQGKKPLYTATLVLPRYNKYRDTSTLYWKYTKKWTQIVYSWQTR